MALRLVSLFFVIQVSSAFSANATDALFFSEFGVERLPPMIVLAGLVVLVVLLGHSAAIGRFGATVWLPVVTGFCSILAMASWGLSLSGFQWAYPVIWVGSQTLIWLTFSVMWNGAAASCDTRQAKRLYPLFASGGVAGAILGNLFTGPAAAITSTETLLGLQGLALAVAAYQMSRAARGFQERPEAGHRVIGELRSAVQTIAASNLLRRVSVVAFGFSTLFFLVVFPFNEAVAARFETAADTAQFLLGVFSSVATGATFLTSLLVARRLFARIGVVASLLTVPIAYVIGFSLWLWSFDLTTASLVRGAQWVVVNAIGGTAMFSLYNVLSGRRRGQVAAFVTAVPTQLGIAAGGLVLTTPLDGDAMFAVGLAGAVLLLVVITGMKTAYVSALIEAVRSGLIGVFRAPHPTVTSPLGRESAALLVELLEDPSPQAKLVGIAGLAAAGEADHAVALKRLLDHDDGEIRVATLDALDVLVPDAMEDLLGQCLVDPDPRVRSHALRSLARRHPDSATVAASRMIKDPSVEVAAVAAWLLKDDDGGPVLQRLMGNDDADVLATVLAAAPDDVGEIELSPLLSHPDSRVRVHAASRMDDPETLRPLLDDPAVPVRQAVSRRLAQSGKRQATTPRSRRPRIRHRGRNRTECAHGTGSGRWRPL